MNAILLALATLLGGQPRFDDATSAILSQELEALETTVYETFYAETKGRTFVPVNNQYSGADTISYKMWDRFGMAKAIANYADDVPMVSITANKTSITPKPYAIGYQYSIQDLKNAAFAGIPLDTMDAQAALQGFEILVDDVALMGDDEFGLTGLMNNANVPTVSPDTGDWTTTATALQVLQDLEKLVQSVAINSKGIFQANAMVMDHSTYMLLDRIFFSADNTVSVMAEFKRKHPEISVDYSARDSMSTNDTAGTGPRIVCYYKNPMVLELFIPDEYSFQPAQAKGLAFVVNGYGTTAGVGVRYPFAMAYMEGHL